MHELAISALPLAWGAFDARLCQAVSAWPATPEWAQKKSIYSLDMIYSGGN